MIWDRATLKFYAKEQLKQYYWTAFVVCLVGGILGANTMGGGFSFRYQHQDSTSSSYSGGGSSFFDENAWILYAIIFVALMIVVVAAAFGIFVSNPVRVGMCSFFQTAPWGNRDFMLLFSSFRRGRFLPIVKTMFLKNLSVFLWSLLFVIPGIIKSYQYYMVPYLISECPYLTPQEAMSISKEMTQGHKFDIWVLEVSFIGWYLLGVLALLVGVLFVTPYVEATFAQLYFALRQGVNLPPPPGHQGQ